MIICGIYKIINKVNRKFYVGSSDHIRGRWSGHRSRLKRNKHINPILQKAWNKYGEENFNFSIIEECHPKILLEREQFYLDTLKPFRGVGYNILRTAGGGNSFIWLSKKQQKIFKEKSIHFGKDNGMYGKEHTTKTKNSMKQRAKGRFSLEWFQCKYGKRLGTQKYEARRKFLSERKIKHVYDNGMTGKKRRPLTDTEKKKISDCRLRMKLIEEDLRKCIQSQDYTINQLVDKFKISKLTVLSRKRRYL